MELGSLFNLEKDMTKHFRRFDRPPGIHHAKRFGQCRNQREREREEGKTLLLRFCKLQYILVSPISLQYCHSHHI